MVSKSRTAYLNDHVHVKVPGVETNSLIKGSPLNIIQVHGNIHLQMKYRGISHCYCV